MSLRSCFVSFRRFLLPFVLLNVIILVTIYYVLFPNQSQSSVKYIVEQSAGEASIGQQSTQGKQTSNKPLILIWTRIFREQSMQLQSDCPLFQKCEITYDHGRIHEASAIIFHIPDVKWIMPLNAKSLSFDLPELPDLPHQKSGERQPVNVFLSQENPTMLAELYKTKHLELHIQNYFHWIMSYLHESHVPMPYGGFWISPAKTALHGFTPIVLPTSRDEILGRKKEKGILWMVSNCHASSKRELAVEALQKYINVTIGGKCAKTAAGRNLCPRGNNCDPLFSNYYFYIAAENDICRGYVTEKFWDRYKFPAVPIVVRDFTYKGIVPDNSYIAMDQFAGPKALADHLYNLIDNPEEYLRYFEWRTKGWSIAPWNHPGFRIGQCGLCERLLRISNGTEPFPSALPNAVQWFEQNSKCEGGEFLERWIRQ